MRRSRRERWRGNKGSSEGCPPKPIEKPSRHDTRFPMSNEDPDRDEEADRTATNIFLAVGFVVLVGGGIWLANAMIDARKADECLSSGRRNCNPIEAPAR